MGIFHFKKENLRLAYYKLKYLLSEISNSQFSSKYVLIVGNYLGFALVFASISICLLKAVELENYGSKILPELIAPVKLTKNGESAFDRLINNQLNKSDLCQKNLECKNNNEVEKSILNSALKNFANTNKDNEYIYKLIKENKFTAYPAVYRGYFFHHYSTILFSYREFKAGNYLNSFTNQYGFVALLPLFFLEGKPFYYYPLLALLLLSLSILMGAVLIKDRRLLIIYGILSLLVATTILVPGIRISPGFSIYRFIPLILVSLIIYTNNLKQFGLLKLFLITVLLMINSLQFNILLFLIYLISLSVFSFRQILGYIFTRISTLFIIIILIQSSIYFYFNLDLRFPLFSSVESNSGGALFTISILAFPLLMFLTKLKYSWQEAYAYVAYILLSSYALAFYKSAQHYSDFILIALPYIYLIIKNSSISFLAKILLPIYFCLIAFFMGFVNAPKISKNVDSSPSYYEYSNVGADLKFEIPNNIDYINAELSKIVKDNKIKNYYFISKDKVYIEMFNNKNMYPKNFDIFVNLNFVRTSKLLGSMKRNNIHYLIMDSDTQREYSADFVDSVGRKYIFDFERLAHLRLIERSKEIAEDLKPYLLHCTQRYCIYYVP